MKFWNGFLFYLHIIKQFCRISNQAQEHPLSYFSQKQLLLCPRVTEHLLCISNKITTMRECVPIMSLNAHHQHIYIQKVINIHRAQSKPKDVAIKSLRDSIWIESDLLNAKCCSCFCHCVCNFTSLQVRQDNFSNSGRVVCSIYFVAS